MVIEQQMGVAAGKEQYGVEGPIYPRNKISD
jgi:hypothetical protein